LLVDDKKIGVIDQETQIKIGGFLTNLMMKNLKYNIGKREYLLLNTEKKISEKNSKSKEKDFYKKTNFLVFNKAFIE